MKKIKLYHYSNADIKDKISAKYFADNFYTSNDYNVSKVKRVFYYLDKDKIEYRFLHSKYLYVTEVNPQKLYDIQEDKYEYLKRLNIHTTLIHLRNSGYIGVTYNIGINMTIAVIFKDLPIKQTIIK